MSDSGYTPTTDEIREYIMVGDPKPWEAPSPEVDARERRRGEAFDRWLTAHDAEVARKALLDAADALPRIEGTRITRQQAASHWLRDHADQIGESK